MENKKHWNTDEIKTLELEDLESVAGGWEATDMTPDEKARFDKLVYNYVTALSALNNGGGMQEDRDAVDKAFRELDGFTKEMEQKYGR